MEAGLRGVAILGSTGSIGRNAVEVISSLGGNLRVVALVARRDIDGLLEQALRVRPRWVVVVDPKRPGSGPIPPLPPEVEVLVGQQAVVDVVTHPDVDIVLSAIVGRAGLEGTWAAVAAGKRVALANKETLVMAGPLVMELAAQTGAEVIPVDSEHSAVFQAIQAGGRQFVRRVILTASGGPFRNRPAEELTQVTVDEALQHPTWQMGKKITIDSATLMNKALEVIEARWLFDLQPEQIGVLIHPQSIVHALVEFVDGSVLGQMSPPDMRLPIQLALTWPQRQESPALKLDWTQTLRLEFQPPTWKDSRPWPWGWKWPDWVEPQELC